MELFDKIKEFIGVPNDEFDEDDENVVRISDPDSSRIHTRVGKGGGFPEAEHVKTPTVETRQKVVNLASAAKQPSVVLVRPERFEESNSVADHLNDKHTVILNLEATNKETARRILDFISGVAYANNGQVSKVANNTFIITPFNVSFEGDSAEEIELGSVYF